MISTRISDFSLFPPVMNEESILKPEALKTEETRRRGDEETRTRRYKMWQRVKRRQEQWTETDINTSVSSCGHAAPWTLLSAAAPSAEGEGHWVEMVPVGMKPVSVEEMLHLMVPLRL
ncbi:unnamed protein product [Pleuronectes platessa]|uniref:Uncharacterized protein n=1 Tax=Pleuronectes platessa TaxID=8262 RepID=A0A9N7TYI2_PLEPL|nr:unnamed protein product [Pleuronectes platessa]